MEPEPAQVIDDRRAEPTVSRWRRAFLVFYLVFTFAAVVTAFFSLLAVHCGGRPTMHKGPRIREDGSDSRELRSCQNELDRLLRDLHREALVVQQKALRFDTDPAPEWQNWSVAWRLRSQALEYRCRFRDLPESGNPEVEKMATIHSALDELQLAYGAMVSRFTGSYAQRLRQLRDQLLDVRKMIDRRKPSGRGADPETRGATR